MYILKTYIELCRIYLCNAVYMIMFRTDPASPLLFHTVHGAVLVQNKSFMNLYLFIYFVI